MERDRGVKLCDDTDIERDAGTVASSGICAKCGDDTEAAAAAVVDEEDDDIEAERASGERGKEGVSETDDARWCSAGEAPLLSWRSAESERVGERASVFLACRSENSAFSWSQ